MFHKVFNKNGVHIGHETLCDSALIFFGNKNSSLNSVRDHYSNLDFTQLKQVHGNTVVKRSSNNASASIAADGHYTSESNLGLTIMTADCVPILGIYSDGSVFALHAGWRGVEKKIANEAIYSSSVKFNTCFIGPSIGPESFEVGLDVLEKILKSAPEEWPQPYNTKPHMDSDKSYVDLVAIIEAQLQKTSGNSTKVHQLKKCTFLDSDYWSYRRQGTDAGRQISFIAKVN